MTKTRVMVLTLVLLGALALAACNRSANPGGSLQAPPASETPAGQGGGGDDAAMQATMAVVMTNAAANQTATAIISNLLPTETPAAPVETLPPQPTTPPIDQPTPVPPTEVPAQPTAGPQNTPVPGAACANPYEVQVNDWIYKIARNCSVTPDAIIAANPGITPNRIYPGQKLNMPAPGATPVKLCAGTYTIQRGDTLFRLAYNCGLTVEELAALNNISYPYLLQIGQVIKYP
jgi:LysM repeat protein